MPPEEKNRIENLKQSMYSRNAPDVRTRRKLRFTNDQTDMKKDWSHPEAETPEEVILNQAYQEQPKHHRMSFTTKLFIGSVLFCIVAVGAGAYIFFNGGNFISGDNIAIEMSGPISIPGGTPVTLTVTVTNRNSVALKGTILTIHYPAGATDPNDTTKSLEDHQETLGDIAPGEAITKTYESVVFGEENSQKKIIATVTYGIAGSSSTFTKESSYDVLINSSPVNITVISPKETNSGLPFDMTVTVKSNSTNTLKNILLKASYPFGYAFKSASQKPSSNDNTTWALGDIAPGGSRTIVVSGALTGEDSDLRAFHFSVGARNPASPLQIGTGFTETEQDLTIQKPYISLAIGIDNDQSSSDHVGRFGKSVNVNVRYVNNLPETLSNVVITLHLAGSAYNKSAVSTFGGYFRSATDDVIWSQQTNPGLASVPAGGTGNLTFAITPSENRVGGRGATNPEIIMTGGVTGDRPGATNVVLNTGAASRNLKIISDVSLSGRVVRSTGSFVNTGPIPPIAEQKTTYTVIWSVDNTANSIGNAVVTATLPPYVNWTSQYNPQTEDVNFDKNSSTITWNIGNVNTFTFGTSLRREIEFQISLEPSVDQVGQYPVLVNQAVLTANDTWTKTTVQDTQGYMTTSFSTDPTYKTGDETVRRN